MQKPLTVGGGHTLPPLTVGGGTHPPPPPPSLAPLARTLFLTAPLKLNPGYATECGHYVNTLWQIYAT